MSEWPFGDLPRGHYGAIHADPPWHFATYNEKGRQRSPDWKKFKGSPHRHYATLETAELALLPVGDLAAPDSALFMWISWPMLIDALALIDAWGFVYKTCAFSWAKAHADQLEMFQDDMAAIIGMGYWTRANSEVCLLATRGKPKRLNADVRQGIIEPCRQHSRKPDCVPGRIERLVAGPYLELWARQSMRPNWSYWGNEVTKFNKANVAIQSAAD